jgi:ParB family chromosome partitioning protein
MNQYLHPKSLDTSLINFEDFSYSISPDREIILDETFTQSIIKHGILHPPIVKEIEPGSYVIVAGRKRLFAIRALFPEGKTCNCMIIPAKMQEIDIFSILLEDILFSRKLTPIEKAIFLQKISSTMTEKQIAKKILPRIDLPSDPFYYLQSIKLLNLEEPIIREIHQGNVNEKAALDIISLSAKDRLAVFHVMSSLRLSVSNQKKLLNICKELASRMDRTISAILGDTDVQNILNHKEANPPQKAKNLMNCLSRKYMPRSSQAEDEFKLFIASMQLPRNVSVNHSPFFENDEVILSITFSNKESVQNAWKTIKETIEKSDN